MESASRFQLISLSKNDKIYEETNPNFLQLEYESHESIKKQNGFSSDFNRNLLMKIDKQNENHIDWFKEDINNMGLFFHKLFSINEEENQFTLDSSNNKEKDDIFIECNSIATKFLSNKFSWKILANEWESFSKYLPNKISKDGLNMKQSILRINKYLNLRSLSCKIETEIKIQGSSMFSFLIRSSENFDNDEAYIIQYRKEGFCDSTRLYVLLGKIERDEFIFVKKCEIPLLNTTTQLRNEDILKVVIQIMDFGNDKIYINTWVTDKLSKPFKLKYENLLSPLFENFKLYLLSNGDDSYIKSMMIEIFDRYDFFLEKENKHSCNKCKNCLIF